MLSVLFVCTGNLCRSPTAEAAFGALVRDLPVDVSSAGILDLGKRASPPELIEVAARHGLDLGDHTSRYLGELDVSGFDLVIGMALEHVATAVVDHGSPQERTFTLLEITDLLHRNGEVGGADPMERAAITIEKVHLSRPSGGTTGIDIDLPDPLGQGADAYARSVETISKLCRQLAEGLFGTDAISSTLWQ